MKKSTTLALTAIAFAASAATSAFAAETVIGLITKTDSNPFFVKMKEGAESAAKKAGVKLLSAAGKQDGDTAGQISAMENMVAAGAKTILITSSGDAIIPTIKKIQAQGVQVIALDSPVEGLDRPVFVEVGPGELVELDELDAHRIDLEDVLVDVK